MHPKRRIRLFTVLFLFAGAAISVAFVLVALNENINMFYPPDKVVTGVAPVDTQIRAGGMVLEGSIARVGKELDVRFVLTDYQGSQFPVIYSGILPDFVPRRSGSTRTGPPGRRRYIPRASSTGKTRRELHAA